MLEAKLAHISALNEELLLREETPKLFKDSLILSNMRQQVFLAQNIPSGPVKLWAILLYRGSRDGWNPDDFHKYCDRNGPTVVLIQTTKGRVCGGFTKVSWGKADPIVRKNLEDSSAFVFSLDTF